jgi:hypothetical protein
MTSVLWAVLAGFVSILLAISPGSVFGATEATSTSPAWLYWTNANYYGEAGADIERSMPDGTAREALVAPASPLYTYPSYLAFDLVHKKMYWSNSQGPSGSGEIRRANLDGTSVETVIRGLICPLGIAIDGSGGYIYWAACDSTSGKIQRSKLDGTEKTDLVTVPPNSSYMASAHGIALDVTVGKIYWANTGRGTIQRANLDGSSVENIAISQLYPQGVTLDLTNNKVYWTGVGISRANLNGSAAEFVVSGDSMGIAIDASGGKMYWTSPQFGKIRRANLDGTNVEDIVTTGLDYPWGVALLPPSESLAVTIDIKPGSYPNSINLGSAGVVPVAILSSSTFDAQQVDPATVALAGAKVKLIGKGDKYSCSVQDVNGDGLPDLVCHVLTAQFMIEPGESVAVLEASTFGGQVIRGEDSIRIVP